MKKLITLSLVLSGLAGFLAPAGPPGSPGSFPVGAVGFPVEAQGLVKVTAARPLPHPLPRACPQPTHPERERGATTQNQEKKSREAAPQAFPLSRSGWAGGGRTGEGVRG